MRVPRIELESHPWQGRVLPLNHTRLTARQARLRPPTYYTNRLISNCASALGGIRTPNNGSEDRCDIHFTTRALDYHTIISGKPKDILKYGQ